MAVSNKYKTYPFHRNSFYELMGSLSSPQKAVFLTGPRKCGKTVCLLQAEEEMERNPDGAIPIYINVKAIKGDAELDGVNVTYVTYRERMSIVQDVIADIRGQKNVVWLLDEVTYLPSPDVVIAQIAGEMDKNPDSPTRVVFSGSASRAIEAWGHLAFASTAAYISMNFLTYQEWLSYTGTEPSEETYASFIEGTRSFYRFSNTKNYLRSCLDETAISNNRSVEYIYDNGTDRIDTECLLDVLYATLISRHNHTSYQAFADRGLLLRTVEAECNELFGGIGEQVVLRRAAELLANRYEKFRQMDVVALQQAFQFLSRCGLITITTVTDSLNENPILISDLISERREPTKTQLLRDLNATISYPMFYVDLLQYLLQEKMPFNLPRSVLGSIVECHARDLLPKRGAMEYHDSEDREIDYVNPFDYLAVEISISDKSLSRVNFGLLSPGYRKILLTKTIENEAEGVEMIPYYVFLSNPERTLSRSIYMEKRNDDATGADDGPQI